MTSDIAVLGARAASLGAGFVLIAFLVGILIAVLIGWWLMKVVEPKGYSKWLGFGLGFGLTFVFSILGAIIAIIVCYVLPRKQPQYMGAGGPVLAGPDGS